MPDVPRVDLWENRSEIVQSWGNVFRTAVVHVFVAISQQLADLSCFGFSTQFAATSQRDPDPLCQGRDLVATERAAVVNIKLLEFPGCILTHGGGGYAVRHLGLTGFAEISVATASKPCGSKSKQYAKYIAHYHPNIEFSWRR